MNKMMKFFEELRANLLNIEKLKDVAALDVDVARILINNGLADVSRNLINEARLIFKKFDLAYNVAITYMLEGQACCMEGKPAEGVDKLNIAKKMFKSLNAKREVATCDKLMNKFCQG